VILTYNTGNVQRKIAAELLEWNLESFMGEHRRALRSRLIARITSCSPGSATSLSPRPLIRQRRLGTLPNQVALHLRRPR
jgi:hypothetical protein